MSTNYTLNGVRYSGTGNAPVPAGATDVQDNGGGGYLPGYVAGTPISYSNGAYNFDGKKVQVDAPITPTSLTPFTPIQLPQTPTPADYSGAIAGGNLGLGIGSKDKNGNPVSTTIPVQNTDQPTNTLDATLKANKDLFDSYINANEPPPSLANEYKQAEADAGIAQKQQAVNDITAQINAITAQSQADQLRETGQGRGIPEAIIGGRQAQIAKEAAIKVLPLQASLAAAQGNLNFAKDRLDTFFKLRTDDITNEYNYKKDTRDAVYNFATDQQKIKIAALQKADDRAYDLQKSNLDLINSWGKTAIENGYSNIIPALAKLDPSAKDFQTQLGRLTSQIKPKPAAAPKTTADERASSALAKFSAAFVPGAKLPGGVAVIDQNNKITPVAWRQAIADAPAEGLSREQFIKQFGYLLYADKNGISSSYGLTPVEMKLINGSL